MTIMVTGGGGFLGLAIVRLLIEQGEQVRTFNRGAYAELDALPVAQVRGDLANAAAVDAALAGCDTVFHVAAKAGFWGGYDDFYQANVVGTQNIIDACRRHGIKKLIYTSSPSVVYGGGNLENIDESQPYAEHFESHYPATKAQAEKLALAANGDSLSTVALRPHLIWGPGDNQLVPRIVARAAAGRLRLIGSGDGLIDTTYIDDAAQAHLDAWRQLAPDSVCAGRAYFISQGEPRPVRDMINGFVQAAGLPVINKSIPFWLAYTVGLISEFFYRLLPLKGEPIMTRFLARQLSTAHWFNISAARRDLAYAPKHTIEQGLELLAEDFRR